MNKVVLMGRLTRDPNVRYSQNEKQTAVARMTIAVDRRFKREGQPDADFFNCVAFGKTAEVIEKYMHKGQMLFLRTLSSQRARPSATAHQAVSAHRSMQALISPETVRRALLRQVIRSTETTVL